MKRAGGVLKNPRALPRDHNGLEGSEHDTIPWDIYSSDDEDLSENEVLEGIHESKEPEIGNAWERNIQHRMATEDYVIEERRGHKPNHYVRVIRFREDLAPHDPRLSAQPGIYVFVFVTSFSFAFPFLN